jgi:hypothetical protein
VNSGVFFNGSGSVVCLGQGLSGVKGSKVREISENLYFP